MSLTLGAIRIHPVKSLGGFAVALGGGDVFELPDRGLYGCAQARRLLLGVACRRHILS